MHGTDPEASENCGGSNPDAQHESASYKVGALAHPAYLLKVTVAGLVEDQASIYDHVWFGGEFLFMGRDNGNECAMASETGSVHVVVREGLELLLEYFTVDGLYHHGAYAEVADVEFIGVFELDLDADTDRDGTVDDEGTRLARTCGRWSAGRRPGHRRGRPRPGLRDEVPVNGCGAWTARGTTAARRRSRTGRKGGRP